MASASTSEGAAGDLEQVGSTNLPPTASDSKDDIFPLMQASSEENQVSPSQSHLQDDQKQQFQLLFRQVVPTDISACFEIERASYPRDEAASKSALQYRQHYAEKYFRCCCVVTQHPWSLDDHEDAHVNESNDTQTVHHPESNSENQNSNSHINSSHHHDYEEHCEIVGFICATRCRVFTEEALATHDASGPLLAIHSIVVSEAYRRQGIATAMIKNYVQTMESMPDGVDKIVLMAKENLLGFYVKCGFSVLRKSDIVHGKEQWYHLERPKDLGCQCWVVDAFAENAGEGNPAGVVLLSQEPANPDWCRKVAKEFNLSETAFVWKLETTAHEDANTEDQSTHCGIRYYTSNGTEVDLCGHATLASAAVLFQQWYCQSITFHSNFEKLLMTPIKHLTSRKMQIAMSFPQKELVDTDTASRTLIVEMLQRTFPKLQDRIEASIIYTGVDQDGNDLLVEVTPDFLQDIGYAEYDIIYSSLLAWDGYRRGVILCCCHEDEEGESASNVDFVSRFFGPKCGIPEDPVTGSAHCVLATYYAQKLGKTELKAEQRSCRGGRLTCIMENYRVTIVGSAIVTLSGTCWILS